MPSRATGAEHDAVGTLQQQLFYSVCARYTDRMAFPEPGAAARALFGISKVGGGAALAGNLDILLSALPPGTMLSARRIVYDHTLLPFHVLFLEPHRFVALRDSMNNQRAARTANGGGIRHTIASPWLRYCEACVDDDRKRYGECYWHRVHQLPGVLVCPTHAIALCETDRRTTKKESVSIYVSLERWLQSAPPTHNSMAISATCLVPLSRLACDAQWLLHAQGISLQLEHLHERYHAALVQRGLATHSGRVHVSALETAFAQYYPAELLTLLDCRLDTFTGSSWLGRLLRRPYWRNQPLHHLLLIAFLWESVAAFVQPITQPAPFGAGPWPCLNPAAHHYRGLTITECTLTYNHSYLNRPPHGRFACACGFVYSRTGPDRTEADRFRVGRVITYGDEWDTRFRQLWNDPSVTLTNIKKQMRIGTREAAQRHALRLGLEIWRTGRGGSAVAPLGPRRIGKSEL